MTGDTHTAPEVAVDGCERGLHQSALPRQLLARFAAVTHLYGNVIRESDAGLGERLNIVVNLRQREMRALAAAFGTLAGTTGDETDLVGSLASRIDRGCGLARTLARAEQLLQELLDRAIEPITGGHPAYGQLVRSHEASMRWRNALVSRGLDADPAATFEHAVDDVFKPACRKRHRGRPVAN